LGLGSLPKQRLGQKLAWVWAMGASKQNLGPPRISASVGASNFKFGTQLEFETSLPIKTTFKTEIGGVWARRASEKYVGPLFISATVEASNFKFSTQLGFGLAYQTTTFRTKIGDGLGQGSIEKLGPFKYFCNR